MLLLLLFTPACLAATLQRIDLPELEYPGGVCNDGTRAGYFHDTNVTKQGKKVHVMLRGGNLCDSQETCLDRCDSDHNGEIDNRLCTADTRESLQADSGFFSSEPANPLNDYWHVDVPYCTSDTWAGTRNPSEETNSYAFHGKTVFRNVMNHMSHHFNLFEATHFVLSGTSAGGFGVGLNCDDVADWLHANNPDMDIKCIADAPDFIAPEVHAPECYRNHEGYQAELQDFWKRDPDHSCWKWATDPVNGVADPALHCGILTNALQHVSTPIFILVDLLDKLISRDYGCFLPGQGAGDDILVEEWKVAMFAHVTKAVENHPGGRLGFFSPNCNLHVINGGQLENIFVPDLNNPDVSLNAFQAIRNWMENTGPYVMVDSPTETNPACSEYI